MLFQPRYFISGQKKKTVQNCITFTVIVLKDIVETETDRLEDLKGLKRSSDLLNNVKIGQRQLRLITETYFVLPYLGVAVILVKVDQCKQVTLLAN